MLALALAVALGSVACDNRTPVKPDRRASKPNNNRNKPTPHKPTPHKPAAKGAATTKASEVPTVPTRLPAVDRIVAIGDVHGDLAATKAALKLGGLIDDDGHWSGGTTTFVQTGDVLDRGDDEQAILDLLARLRQEAPKAGGSVHILNGNHELMNAMGDFRYATPGGLKDFEDVPGLDLNDPILTRLPSKVRHRAAAFLPGGVYAQKLAAQPVVLIVGENVFVHGGVLPKHTNYGLDRINYETSAWLAGADPAGGRAVNQPDSVVWMRHYSDNPDAADCQLLKDTLTLLKAKRMVVGHTPQSAIRPACDDKVWRIDSGMARAYPGKPAALEIKGDVVRVLD